MTSAATYLAAEQVADFGGTQSSLTVRVYQRSPEVGRGAARIAIAEGEHMSGTTTPRLALPYIAVGQAQKELAHSQGMNRIDALLQATVQQVGLNTPRQPG